MTIPVEPVERHVVDNRTFILGLDELYRSSMRKFETTRLLDCARTVAQALGAAPANVPVEGYYTRSAALTEYFQLMRALQALDDDQAWRVKSLPEFSLLHALAVSGCFGQPGSGGLLPRGMNALTLALAANAPAEWSTPTLVARARATARETGDFSLVALAARTGDPVLLAATSESVVLYTAYALGDDIENVAEYVWQVDDELSIAANRFIETLNQFGIDPLPPAQAASAEAYYEAATDARVMGRCAAIGYDPESQRHYHWGIAGGSLADFHVDDFWDPQLWTTDRYLSQQIIKNRW